MLRRIIMLSSAALIAGCSGATTRPERGLEHPATAAVPHLKLSAVGHFERPVQAVGVPGTQQTIVVEQGGRVLLVDGMQCTRSDGCPDTPVTTGRTLIDLRAAVSRGPEQGLLGFAFHPSWPRDPLVYVNYTDAAGDTRVEEWFLDSSFGRALRRRQLLRVEQPYDNHNGGGLVFGPDSLLYVGTGDGGSAGDPEQRAQDPDSLLGKMLRIDVDGTDGAPRAATAEVWGIGLRNPWRYSFDRSTGDLWIGDVGQDRREEVNVVARAQLRGPGPVNFGWNLHEGFDPFEEDAAVGPGMHIRPVIDYPHARGCSVTGGVVYRGARIDQLQGWYLFGDVCTDQLLLIDADRAASAPRRRGAVRLHAVAGVQQVVHVGETGDGELLVVSHDGGVYEVLQA